MTETKVHGKHIVLLFFLVEYKVLLKMCQHSRSRQGPSGPAIISAGLRPMNIVGHGDTWEKRVLLPVEGQREEGRLRLPIPPVLSHPVIPQWSGTTPVLLLLPRCPASTGPRRPLAHLVYGGVFPMWGPHNGAYALASHWTRTLRTTQQGGADRAEAALPKKVSNSVSLRQGGQQNRTHTADNQ